MRFTLMALAATVLVAAPAIAQTDAAPAKEKKICRRDGPPTGSIMGARSVCHTKAEWTQIDQRNSNNAGNMLDRSREQQGLTLSRQ